MFLLGGMKDMRKPFKRDSALFMELIETLSGNDNSSETISWILNKVCSYFCFGFAFIYESDHTNTFYLKEFCRQFDSKVPPENLRLENHLGGITIYDSTHSDSSAELAELMILLPAHSLLAIPVIDDAGAVVGLVGLADRRKDFSISTDTLNDAKSAMLALANQVRLRIYKQKISYAYNFLEHVLDNAGVSVYVNDYETHEILYVNKVIAAAYGGADNLIGKPCWLALHKNKAAECDYCPKKYLKDEHGNPTKTYAWDYYQSSVDRWFHAVSGSFLWADGRTVIVITTSDITEKKRTELLIEKLAFEDALTKLMNRHKFQIDFSAILKRSIEENKRCHILFLDLDKFKLVNDNYGHVVGDQLLAAISAHLLADPLTASHSYRIGGDEFVLLYEGMTDDAVMQIQKKLAEDFLKPWKLESVTIFCNASIGVAAYPDDGADFDTLTHAADQAMYLEKESRKQKNIY